MTLSLKTASTDLTCGDKGMQNPQAAPGPAVARGHAGIWAFTTVAFAFLALGLRPTVMSGEEHHGTDETLGKPGV